MGFLNIQPFIKEQFEKEFYSNTILQNYLKLNSLYYNKLLAYGTTSWIVIVKNNESNLFAIKLQKEDAYRNNAIENEYRFLKIVNDLNIGQKVLDYNKEGKFIIWEYIDATPFKFWVKSANSKLIDKAIKESLEQAKKLDSIGIDHSQLAGAGTNIIVKNDGTPLIVDFEKASLNRKAHNYNVLANYFSKLKR